MTTTNQETPDYAAWTALLNHPEIDRLLDAYLGENADVLVAGRPGPPLQDYLIGSGMTNVPASSVSYAGRQVTVPVVPDGAYSRYHCRLVYRTVDNATGCFWVCPD